MFKKIANGIKNFGKRIVDTVKKTVNETVESVQRIAAGTKAEAYVDTGVKILIGVVIGALVLGGIYALFNTTILPTVSSKITELFNYKA